MSFGTLSYSYSFTVNEFPENWIPLVYLYDPDLPSFPLYYFHVLSPLIEEGTLPGSNDRAFGYIQKINFIERNRAEIVILTNKDFTSIEHTELKNKVEMEIKERLGLNTPVTYQDIQNVFQSPNDDRYSQQNNFTCSLWNHIVLEFYNGKLPFGRIWDGVFGLGRFVASFNSPSGRKGEMIMTHYYASRFGQKIASSKKIDFYLLPTYEELINLENALDPFPNFKKIVATSNEFCENCCELIEYSGFSLSKFIKNESGTGSFDTKKFKTLINEQLSLANRPAAFECFNTFNKGPGRALIFFMMLHDIRLGHIRPDTITSQQCGEMYDNCKSSYQSPKVIQLYAQQCFGNTHAMPIDTWIKTFLKWPYNLYPNPGSHKQNQKIFSMSENFGKFERLLWITAQARKVHSSACNDRLWCIKYGYSDEEVVADAEIDDDDSKYPRGANPFSCGICDSATRNICPSFGRIKNLKIAFNSPILDDAMFAIWTSNKNNTTHNQKFEVCEGNNYYSVKGTDGKYRIIRDNFSPTDKPESLTEYPSGAHNGEKISVADFIRIYIR